MLVCTQLSSKVTCEHEHEHVWVEPVCYEVCTKAATIVFLSECIKGTTWKCSLGDIDWYACIGVSEYHRNTSVIGLELAMRRKSLMSKGERDWCKHSECIQSGNMKDGKNAYEHID